MMKKSVEFFNLSFLDLLSGALGAVIFLFIIVPKGDGEGPAAQPQLYVSYDTIQKKFFGEIPDSLLHAGPGDTLLAMVYDFKKAPKAQSVRYVPPKKKAPEPVKKTPKAQSKPKSPSVTIPKAESTPIAEVKPIKQAKPKPAQTIPEYKGSKPDVPCVLSIEAKWQSPKDNVDLVVCKDQACVFGGKKKHPAVGFWDSGKARTSIFGGDLRTNQEAVRQFDAILPGEYQIFAQYKEAQKPKDELPLRLIIYTRNKQGAEQGETLQYKLTFNPEDRSHLGTAVIDTTGRVQFTNLH